MAQQTSSQSTAAQLLDAQVQYVLGELKDERLHANIARDVDALLDLAQEHPLNTLLQPSQVKEVVHRLLSTVPASTAASTLVEAGADVIHQGPAEAFSAADLIEREHVESIVDEALSLHPLVADMLDQLTQSPLVANVASRFMTRIVADVLQANRNVAEKIPGVGSLMKLGAGAASSVLGAADKQFEQLLGDTAGKGAVFAMRRLNKIVVETLKDPMVRDAALQVWDLYADQRLRPLNSIATQDDIRRVGGILQEIVIGGATTAPVRNLVDAMIDMLFEQYGEHPVTTLLEELDISRDDLVADVRAILPDVLAPGLADGGIEKLVRDRLEPFFSSPEVAAVLAG